jgi:hypothetical protein
MVRTLRGARDQVRRRRCRPTRRRVPPSWTQTCIPCQRQDRGRQPRMQLTLQSSLTRATLTRHPLERDLHGPRRSRSHRTLHLTCPLPLAGPTPVPPPMARQAPLLSASLADLCPLVDVFVLNVSMSPCPRLGTCIPSPTSKDSAPSSAPPAVQRHDGLATTRPLLGEESSWTAHCGAAELPSRVRAPWAREPMSGGSMFAEPCVYVIGQPQPQANGPTVQ